MSLELYNIYCDESCHLEHDHIPVMVLGAIWCKTARTLDLSGKIRDIKAKYNLPVHFEVKWSKVSQGKADFYLSLVDYFFDQDELHFRGVLVPDKTILDHKAYEQRHDDWYYKMMFTLLEPIVDPQQQYCVYLDIKDTQSEQKRSQLEEVLRSKRRDYQGHIIKRVQQIRSHESALLQLAG